jgi:hypothetical protein
VPGLTVVPAQPEGDVRALAELAAWCRLRYEPLTAPDEPDGIWIHANEGVRTGSAAGPRCSWTSSSVLPVALRS